MPAHRDVSASPRDRILSVAGDLFYAHGINAIGLDTIVAQSGAAKTTLYANFGSKDELVAAYRRCPSFRGCPFINATAELPETSRPGRQVVTELRELLRGLAEHCRAQSLLVLAPRHQRHQSHQTGASIEIGVSKSV